MSGTFDHSATPVSHSPGQLAKLYIQLADHRHARLAHGELSAPQIEDPLLNVWRAAAFTHPLHFHAINKVKPMKTPYYEEGDMTQCTARRSAKNYKAMVAADNIEDARALARVMAHTPILHKQMDVEDSAPLFTEVPYWYWDTEDATGERVIRTNYRLPRVTPTQQQLEEPRVIFVIIDCPDNFDVRVLDKLQAAEVVFCMFQTTARDVDLRTHLVGRDKPTPVGWRFFVTRKAITEHTLEDFSDLPLGIEQNQRCDFGVVLCVNLVGDHKLPPLPRVDAPEEFELE